MKKLTAVSVQCRSKRVYAFLMIPVINGKTILTQKVIDHLFETRFGFTPQRGETISYG